MEMKVFKSRYPVFYRPADSIKISEMRDEITLENRICTLEQAEVYMKVVESFMVEMKTLESTRDNRPDFCYCLKNLELY